MQNFFQTEVLEAGVDEAGRGALAGPVVAAAVILPRDFHSPEINDSKKLSEKKREQLREFILENALAYAIKAIDNTIIDEVNILNASFLAMHGAINNLKIQPELLLIDGNKFKTHKIPHECIIKGDAKFASIAAASILAKTTRDEIMRQYHKKFPQYDWQKNKAYPTKFHKLAIDKFGITELHRRTYKTCAQRSLFSPQNLEKNG